MKLQLKLDRQALQTFFKVHVEKILFVGIVLVFLFFVYTAVGRETFQENPESLGLAADRALEHMKNNAAPAGVKAAEYPEKVEKEVFAKVEAEYAWEVPLKYRPFSERGNRDHPELLDVQGLRVFAGRAPFNMVDPQMAEQMAEFGEVGSGPGAVRPERRGQRFAIITGLVPVVEQAEAFSKAFRDVVYRVPEQEMLQYLGFWVERLEVAPDGQYSEDDWKRAAVFTSKNELEEFAKVWTGGRQAQSVAEERFLDPNLAFPLPPRVEGRWGEEVVHEPEVPMKDRLRRVRRVQRVGPGGEIDWMPSKAGELDDWTKKKAGKTEENPEETGEDAVLGEAGYQDQFERPEVMLFRFFDFNVQPGKRYVYRVHLVMRNPNYGVPERHLTQKAKPFADQMWLETPKGATTDVVQIPRDDELLLAEVKGTTNSPHATLRGVKWVNERGIEVSEEFSVSRGDIANYVGKPLPLPMDARFGAVRPAAERPIPGAPGAPLAEPEGEKVHYQSNALALDIRGGSGELLRIGERKKTLLKRPGEVLLLDADLRLVVRHQYDDLVEREARKAQEEPEVLPGELPGGELMPEEYGPEGYPPEGVYGPGGKRERRPPRRGSGRQPGPKYEGKLPVD